MSIVNSGKNLHVLVSDAVKELCRVQMPLTAVDNLADFFPDEDRLAVAAAGVRFPEIIARVKESGFAPQTLLDAQTPARSYRIWIE